MNKCLQSNNKVEGIWATERREEIAVVKREIDEIREN